MKNQMSVLVVVVVALLVSAAGEVRLKYAELGSSVTLDPPPDVNKRYLTWFFQDKAIAWHNLYGPLTPTDANFSMSGMKLILKSVSQEHFGMFVCSVRDTNIKITYRILQLRVFKRPEFPVLAGEYLNLDCHTETPAGLSEPQIHWLDQHGDKVEGSKATHTFTAANQHNGQWTCVVTNGGTVSSGKILVSVADLSTPSSDQRYTSNASPLAVPCSISTHVPWEQIKAMGLQGVHWDFFPKTDSGRVSDYPQRIFSLSLEDSKGWKAADKDTGLVPASDFEKGDLSLARSSGREKDAGDYRCRMEFNNSRSLERKVHVHVLQIVTSPRTELVVGQSANLTCGLGFALPSDLRLKWVRPGELAAEPLQLDDEPALLHIKANLIHNGKWRCELWHNHTREATAEITLKIEPRLSVWMLVIICSAAAIGFLLMLLLFICWQRRQQRMRHPRHRLCKCKNPKPKGFYRT